MNQRSEPRVNPERKESLFQFGTAAIYLSVITGIVGLCFLNVKSLKGIELGKNELYATLAAFSPYILIISAVIMIAGLFLVSESVGHGEAYNRRVKAKKVQKSKAKAELAKIETK